MMLLNIRPQVHRFDLFRHFAKDFKINKRDLIFTNDLLYREFIKPLHLDARVLCRDQFGKGEPNDMMMDAASKEARKHPYERVIAIGGGSIIDMAKMLAIRHDEPFAESFLKKAPPVKDKQLIILPTTTGTGSEMTNISVAHLIEKDTKMALTDDSLFADHAVLIPELAENLPHGFFMLSVIDALVGAAESFLSPKANDFTRPLSLQSCQMILEGLTDMILKGEDRRKILTGDFLTASCIAGITFSNAGTGAVHALAYPLSSFYHVPHGETNYQFFAGIFDRYAKSVKDEKINVLIRLFRQSLEKLGLGKENVFYDTEKMLEKLLPLKRLQEYGMKPEEIGVFSQSVMDNQQRLLKNSYIIFGRREIEEIYWSRY